MFVLSDYQHFEYILNEYMCVLFSCLFVFIFPQGVTGSPLDPRGVGAVDVGHDVVVGVVQASIAESLQHQYSPLIIQSPLFLRHYGPPHTVFPGI